MTKHFFIRIVGRMGACRIAVALAVALGSTMSSGVRADEADAKRLLKAMSDYLAAQEAISFSYDATLEVVTKDDQKLALASSGETTLRRPNKLHTTRAGGHADIEVVFDGTTLTLLGNTANAYTQIEVPGSIDHLIDELHEKYNRPVPAGDLLLSNAYDALMQDVVDVKDLGSGVIGGVECDFLAFRTEEIDWQIWIAHGDRPYPCRYAITSKDIPHSPQYTIQVRDWRTGDEVAATDFTFDAPANAEKIELEDIQEHLGDLPGHFKVGGGQ